MPARDPEPQKTTLLEHPPCTKAAQRGPGPCPLAQLPTTSSLAKLSLHTNHTHSLPRSLRQVTFGLEDTHTHTRAILSLGHRTKNLPQYSRITTTSIASQTIASEHGPVNPQPLKHTPTASPLPGTHVHVVSHGVHPAHPTPALHRSSLGTFRSQVPKSHTNTPQSCTFSCSSQDISSLTQAKRTHRDITSAYTCTWYPSGSPGSQVGFHSHTHGIAK